MHRSLASESYDWSITPSATTSSQAWHGVVHWTATHTSQYPARFPPSAFPQTGSGDGELMDGGMVEDVCLGLRVRLEAGEESALWPSAPLFRDMLSPNPFPSICYTSHLLFLLISNSILLLSLSSSSTNDSSNTSSSL